MHTKSIKYSNKVFRVILTLYNCGVISNFVILRKNKIFIKFTSFFFKNSSFFKKIKPVSTPSKSFFIKKSTIKLIHKTLKSSIIILSTTKGLLTTKDALNLGVGGKITYVIN